MYIQYTYKERRGGGGWWMISGGGGGGGEKGRRIPTKRQSGKRAVTASRNGNEKLQAKTINTSPASLCYQCKGGSVGP